MFKDYNAKDSCYLDRWLQIAFAPGIEELTLKQLGYIEVISCGTLKVIESNAPNISSFYFIGDHRTSLSLGEMLQMKSLHLCFSGAVCYARVTLPSTMPNLETATIYSSSEMADTPMLHSRYLHLKNLSIALSAATFPATYDYFSLVSFLDACPSLKTLVLNISRITADMEHVSIFTDPSDLRQMQDQHHDKIKSVKILGFNSAKSLVELTCHIVENIMSLECLTLETNQSSLMCFVPEHKSKRCSPLPKGVLREAHQALLGIRTYIEPKVPSKVKLHIVETCSRCYAVEL
ncbi:hypothetical protein PR202_ga13584 [Eleusine coracana subsp. coracana]|uniref:At1g61320/AtMIF1 LRR domain-containing protein n=1 Tax=Eleusine coracana subsp. coracana TaxID=191504 RepID=A0AAV5CF77_ELECO|nr:hypothetical protein PR202_ga13584 [Eleusine coracana subsp. coracana]